MLLIDSGAFIHTCPRSEYPGTPLRALTKQPGAIVADGRPLKLYGQKEVVFRTYDGTPLTILFYVSD
eukprot:4443986-Heterocapsa_arctica.AAC.1